MVDWISHSMIGSSQAICSTGGGYIYNQGELGNGISPKSFNETNYVPDSNRPTENVTRVAPGSVRLYAGQVEH